MKKIILLSLTVITLLFTNAQNVAINNNGIAAHNSAMLDIASDNKGVLIPRLTTQQRITIPSPANGLLVFDSDTNSFWFFSVTWKELGIAGAGGGQFGMAGGDLSGSYPTPNVVKIQNLDVAAGVPFDKQILKWDALHNKWQGLNDSLFLPYNAVHGSPTKLFGITNTNTTAGSSAVYGKSGIAGSGITPAGTSGVWGDNSAGAGVIGTANTGQGVYGFSLNNNGVQGYSVLAGRAGIYGSHANDNGIGIMGETQNNGFAVYGKVTGNNGKAGLFESSASSHTDTTLKISTPGIGTLSSFNITSTSSVKPAIDITHAGNGNGLKLRLSKISGMANAIDVLSQGGGIGINSKSENGIAGKFEINNAANTYPAMVIGTNGTGTALYVNSANTGLTGNVVDVLNQGDGIGLSVNTGGANTKNAAFTSSNVNSFEPNLYVEHNGSGRGVEIKLTKAANNNAGLYINTTGNKGAEIISAGAIGVTVAATGNSSVAVNGNTGQTANNAVGVRGTTGANVSGGIGVLGIAGVNDVTGIGVKGVAGGGIAGGVGVLGEGNVSNPQAIGVKGTSYTHNEDVGAVTGINFTDGVGVYGEATGDDGIGVAGTVGNSGNHSVAAVFTNKYVNNNRAVIELISNGKGMALFSDNTNGANTNTMINIRNAGTGNFLRFQGTLTDVTTIQKDGDIITDGRLTVKGDKGIVRNSSSTQLRMEVIQANFIIPVSGQMNFDAEESVSVEITFPTPFTTAPTVYLGNVLNNTTYVKFMQVTITDVTATGCKLNISNTLNHTITLYNNSWKLVAIGAE